MYPQVSDSDLRDATTPTTPHEATHDILEEEPAKPTAAELPLVPSINADQAEQEKRTLEVVRATKRLLESVRLRDFRAYE